MFIANFFSFISTFFHFKRDFWWVVVGSLVSQLKKNCDIKKFYLIFLLVLLFQLYCEFQTYFFYSQFFFAFYYNWDFFGVIDIRCCHFLLSIYTIPMIIKNFNRDRVNYIDWGKVYLSLDAIHFFHFLKMKYW